jgi:redox-sensitive bicupin YhaK (pirin superfamily)
LLAFVSVPPLAPGFIGPGHLAAQMVSAEDYALNDPFIMLADDHLDIGDRPLGEPHSHAGFETVTLILDGAVALTTGRLGWFDRPIRRGSSVMHLVAGEEGAHLVLYAGQPQEDRIVSYGPFIGDSKEDIARLFTEYRAGQFVKISDLAG